MPSSISDEKGIWNLSCSLPAENTSKVDMNEHNGINRGTVDLDNGGEAATGISTLSQVDRNGQLISTISIPVPIANENVNSESKMAKEKSQQLQNTNFGKSNDNGAHNQISRDKPSSQLPNSTPPKVIILESSSESSDSGSRGPPRADVIATSMEINNGPASNSLAPQDGKNPPKQSLTTDAVTSMRECYEIESSDDENNGMQQMGGNVKKKLEIKSTLDSSNEKLLNGEGTIYCKPKFDRAELDKKPVLELRNLLKNMDVTDSTRFTEKEELIDYLMNWKKHDTGNVKINRPKYSERDLNMMAIEQLKSVLKASDVPFDSEEVVKKEDLVKILISSGKITLILDEVMTTSMRADHGIRIISASTIESQVHPSSSQSVLTKAPEQSPSGGDEGHKSSQNCTLFTKMNTEKLLGADIMKSAEMNSIQVPPKVVTTVNDSYVQPIGNLGTKRPLDQIITSSQESAKKTRQVTGIPILDVASTLPNASSMSTIQALEINAQANQVRYVPSSSICDSKFASYVKLDPIPDLGNLPALTPKEFTELERYLQIHDQANTEEGWREDWSGNLQLIDKDLVMNRHIISVQPHIKPVKKAYYQWVAENAKDSTCNGFKGVKLLFSYIYTMKGTPPMARRILSHALLRPAASIQERLAFILDCVKRISYDPIVLAEDGWTTVRSQKPESSSGGSYLIGKSILWSRYEAIVIAFVHDDVIGDLWKAMWLEDLETFDLEADEMQDAIKKWESREARKKSRASSVGSKTLSGTYVTRPKYPNKDSSKNQTRPPSARFANTLNFVVDGIENGIVLATSFHANARHGVLWPARVMHVSEIKKGVNNQYSRRGVQKVHLIFLAPYWNGQSSARAKSNATSPQEIYSSGHLFEMEQLEPSSDVIQKYPYDNTGVLPIDQIRGAFRFLGLPKAAFSRYLDSHRLAVALRGYSKLHLAKNNDINNASAFASLTDCHTLSVRAAQFPPELLNLPYQFMLSKIPQPAERSSLLDSDDGEEITEPMLKLNLILRAMSPPYCFGGTLVKTDEDGKNARSKEAENSTPSMPSTPQNVPIATILSPDVKSLELSIRKFASEDLLCLIGHGSMKSETPPGISPPFLSLGLQLSSLLTKLNEESGVKQASNDHRKRPSAFLSTCLMVKAYGEDVLHASKSPPSGCNMAHITTEWRKCCEKIYRYAVGKHSSRGLGNGVTVVITDSRCNLHLTGNEGFERSVRLPAAIRGAKKAGAGQNVNMPLITKVDDIYLKLAEEKILPMAHKASYLKRIKSKILSIAPGAIGAPLTDDSDGEGGEDTLGSRGSYTAALSGVAAALDGVDRVVRGHCVNAFCAVRPPGHHAGKELRAMNAISNGFCLFNAAACAATYATMSQSDGGHGLKRVCIIDFDVHHGNGTQDILCSTHDPRFLYISVHAGGAHINGYEETADDDDDFALRRSLGGSRNVEGIFPGRCGDTSPHPGVLNLPLGQKVTAHGIGNALMSDVAPAVEAFAPDLLILSAGFDAHKNDPLGMGGLSADDFGSVTSVCCRMAASACSGRILSLLEGGYGVPCCVPRDNLFLPPEVNKTSNTVPQHVTDVLMKRLDLGEDMPEGMQDTVPFLFQQKLDKCHAEGFLDCVREHVSALTKCTRGEKAA